VVEELITNLSRFKSFLVIARNSSFTYKGRGVDVEQVSRELGVRYVLEGSLRKAANRISRAGLRKAGHDGEGRGGHTEEDQGASAGGH
jgi:adenylate cyclase